MTERLPDVYSRVSSRRCNVCKHERRQEIEAALLAGTQFMKIGADFGLSRDSLRSHVRRHLPAALEKGFEAREMAFVPWLTSRIEILHVEICDIIDASRGCPVPERVAAVNAALKAYSLLGRLTGKLVGNGVHDLFARLGVRDEEQLRQMLQVARANVNMSIEDHILNGVEIVLAGLPDRPEMREEVAAKLEKVLKPATPALPIHAPMRPSGAQPRYR